MPCEHFINSSCLRWSHHHRHHCSVSIAQIEHIINLVKSLPWHEIDWLLHFLRVHANEMKWWWFFGSVHRCNSFHTKNSSMNCYSILSKVVCVCSLQTPFNWREKNVHCIEMMVFAWYSFGSNTKAFGKSFKLWQWFFFWIFGQLCCW